MTSKPPSRPRVGKSARAAPPKRTPARANLDAGRVNQKRRTRDALVSVAADFVRRGQDFSVTDVADAARVSRPTAYRYFATPEMLRAQATLFAAGRIETGALDQLVCGAGSPEEKLDALIAGSDAMTAAHEIEFRSMLRLSLDPNFEGGDTPRRPRFRQNWLSSALEQLKGELGEKQFDRLIAALCLMCGIESFVVLHDILQLKPREASDIRRWAARLLLHAAVHEAAVSRTSIARAKTRPRRK